MLIMPTTSTNFQALADGIVDGFFRNNVPLTDGIAKVAVEREFTPEEVTRLTEKTNTAASLYFLKTAEDKKGSFKLAELEDVLRRTHTGDGPEEEDPPAGQEKTASAVTKDGSPFAVYTGLPQREAPRFDFAACFHNGQEKTAAASEAKSGVSMADIFFLEKCLAESRQEKMATELAVQDGIDFLASEFHVWNGPDFGKFAADSLAAYGPAAMPVLEGLAAYLRVPAGTLEKSAAADPGPCVDDTTPRMRVMEGVCGGMRRIIKLAADIRTLETALQDGWRSVKGGAQ